MMFLVCHSLSKSKKSLFFYLLSDLITTEKNKKLL